MENGELINYEWVGYFAILMGFDSIYLSRKIKVVDDEKLSK